MSEEIDFGLATLHPVDRASGRAYDNIGLLDLTVLAEHHTDTTSFLAAHDGSATWGVPGQDQLVAIKIRRNLDDKTYAFETDTHAGIAFAQRWLVDRGCPPEPISNVVIDCMKPADDKSLRIEEQIRTSADRYGVLDTFTWDYNPCETWTMVHDAAAAEAPVRVFLEVGDPDASTYTMREGAFSDAASAQDWLEGRVGPMPEPPEYRGQADALRNRAALARSAGPSAANTAAGLSTSTPSASTALQRPAPGRSK